MRKFIATTAAGLALATGAVALTTFSPIMSAGAQTTTPTVQTQTADPSGKPGHPKLRHLAKAAVKDAAGVIGIEPKELLSDLKAGQSIAEVATAHGVDPQTVIDKLVTDASARVDQAVTNGKLTAEQAAKIKAALPDRVTKLVNKHFDGTHLK